MDMDEIVCCGPIEQAYKAYKGNCNTTHALADRSRTDTGRHNWLFFFAEQIGSVSSGRTCSPNTGQLAGNTQGDNGA